MIKLKKFKNLPRKSFFQNLFMFLAVGKFLKTIKFDLRGERPALILLILILLMGKVNLYAEDIEVKLNSQDGTNKFIIRDSALSNVATFDSNGSLVLESSATVKKALRAAKFLSESRDSNVTLAASDFGKTITVNSASDRTVSLPSVDSGDIGAWFKIIKLSTGKVTIDAADSDTIADSGAGKTIYCSTPVYASLTLQLASETEWVITDGYGRWMTTDPADKTLFNFSYWLKFLPDTGQEQSYTTTFGEDHDYQPLRHQMYFSTFTINGDRVTVDNRTGLMWVTDSEGDLPSPWPGTMTWEDALTACEGLDNFAGYDDWRLPNVKELQSIVDYGKLTAPRIDEAYFTCESIHYWVSTTKASVPANAWNVNFNNGYIFHHTKTTLNYVRPVRGGP